MIPIKTSGSEGTMFKKLFVGWRTIILLTVTYVARIHNLREDSELPN